MRARHLGHGLPPRSACCELQVVRGDSAKLPGRNCDASKKESTPLRWRATRIFRALAFTRAAASGSVYERWPPPPPPPLLASKLNEDLGHAMFGILEIAARYADKKAFTYEENGNRAAGNSLDVYACVLLALRSAPVSRRLKEGRQGFRAYLPLATAIGHSQVALFSTFERYVITRGTRSNTREGDHEGVN